MFQDVAGRPPWVFDLEEENGMLAFGNGSRTYSRNSLLICLVGALFLWSGPVSAGPDSSSADGATAGPARVLAPATPTQITFEADAAGVAAEPFTSKDNPTVHFIDSLGNNLDVENWGVQSDGQGVAVFGDDTSALVILFDVPTTKVSILFGNDDPGVSQAGDRATLTVFRNGKKVDAVNVTMNRDDVANQRTVYTGPAVDKARFVFTRAGAPINLIEIVDSIILAPVCAISGNAAANTLNGTAGHDGMCGKGGADKMEGRGGNDVIVGGPGNDTLTGGDGNDLLTGTDGSDVIRASDGVSGNDMVFGGPGTDSCFVDAGDTTSGCESVVTNP